MYCNVFICVLQLTNIHLQIYYISRGFFVLCSRSATDNLEDRKLLRCLRESLLSPYKKQVARLPVADTSSPARKVETRSLTSPRTKGLASKRKPSPHHESASTTWLSPRRSTPSKRAIVKTRMSTPLRKTKHFRADSKKKTGLTPRRTPGKKRSQTPRKSTKRTPAKSMLTVK